jgi:hypothetical protein
MHAWGLMDVIAEVKPGICGLASRVKASSADGMNVVVGIESACPRIQAYAAQALELDAYQELLSKPLAQTLPVRLAAEHNLHTTCVVPVAVLKAAEVAAGLALPEAVSLELERVE